ncbi:hydroxymethylbilane synthase [Zavarzinia sp. CC-PAN008]|uniref:hydroxymethylbilane synthase n=1 Tax=Zavarzinia sp. CC-PAN008 TaxID=3243332 RepID=UPI003F747968
MPDRSPHDRLLIIGSRGSPLALAQSVMVRDALMARHPGLQVEIQTIKTSGDRIQDRTLSEVGGKGLFTKEIEEALLARTIDLAVHSMKDMPTVLPPGLELVAFLEREDPRDALIGPGIQSLAGLPAGTVVGTASLRRQAQVLCRRPDLTVVPLRGNVQTRLAKLERGEVGVTLLALAGLKRLGMAERADVVLEPDEMLPAVAQGVVGIEIRSDDAVTRALVEPLNHGATEIVLRAERALLAALDGSCRTPIAGLAVHDGSGGLSLKAAIYATDGHAFVETVRLGHIDDASAMGQDAAAELRARASFAFAG